MKELDVLIEQLDELLTDGVVDEEDALEVAMVAGLAARLGAPAHALEGAATWLADDGRSLLLAALAEVDFEAVVEEIEGLTPDRDEEEVEEAVFDFDDLVAAAVWAGQVSLVLPSARRVASYVRSVPEAFAEVAYAGQEMARLTAVARDLDLYDYWLAIADAEEASTYE